MPRQLSLALFRRNATHRKRAAAKKRHTPKKRKRARRNPLLGILGNPPGEAAGTLSSRVYEVRYRHAADGKDYKHSFGPGVRATLLKDGRVVLWHPSKRIWRDFPQ